MVLELSCRNMDRAAGPQRIRVKELSDRIRTDTSVGKRVQVTSAWQYEGSLDELDNGLKNAKAGREKALEEVLGRWTSVFTQLTRRQQAVCQAAHRATARRDCVKLRFRSPRMLRARQRLAFLRKHCPAAAGLFMLATSYRLLHLPVSVESLPPQEGRHRGPAKLPVEEARACWHRARACYHLRMAITCDTLAGRTFGRNTTLGEALIKHVDAEQQVETIEVAVSGGVPSAALRSVRQKGVLHRSTSKEDQQGNAVCRSLCVLMRACTECLVPLQRQRSNDLQAAQLLMREHDPNATVDRDAILDAPSVGPLHEILAVLSVNHPHSAAAARRLQQAVLVADNLVRRVGRPCSTFPVLDDVSEQMRRSGATEQDIEDLRRAYGITVSKRTLTARRVRAKAEKNEADPELGGVRVANGEYTVAMQFVSDNKGTKVKGAFLQGTTEWARSIDARTSAKYDLVMSHSSHERDLKTADLESSDAFVASKESDRTRTLISMARSRGVRKLKHMVQNSQGRTRVREKVKGVKVSNAPRVERHYMRNIWKRTTASKVGGSCSGVRSGVGVIRNKEGALEGSWYDKDNIVPGGVIWTPSNYSTKEVITAMVMKHGE